ncbi:hypothetical protein TNCV_1357571 [Trichonephila clavipes]|uniref:Uncharacterized protein n=1 Tax=Trichonephila clavipes TaxID=2585209 RepID=A0A8X6S8A1_TRICX|nr:hypothetical protein TNCV_1357571 [Trichonephila clavipes]
MEYLRKFKMIICANQLQAKVEILQKRKQINHDSNSEISQDQKKQICTSKDERKTCNRLFNLVSSKMHQTGCNTLCFVVSRCQRISTHVRIGGMVSKRISMRIGRHDMEKMSSLVHVISYLQSLSTQ